MGLHAPTRFQRNLPVFQFTLNPPWQEDDILSRFVPIVRMMQTVAV